MQGQVVILDSSSLILDKNVDRDFFLIKNISPSGVDVYICLSSSATLSMGMPIAKGESIFGDNYIDAVSGIVASGSGKVAYIEVNKKAPLKETDFDKIMSTQK